MKIIRWNGQMRYCKASDTDTAKHLDARDIECDYDTDSDDGDGLECDKDDFD